MLTRIELTVVVEVDDGAIVDGVRYSPELEKHVSETIHSALTLSEEMGFNHDLGDDVTMTVADVYPSN